MPYVRKKHVNKPAIPRRLSKGDKEYIKLLAEGVRKSTAFKQAYPENITVMRWNNTKPGTPERQKAAELVRESSKSKLQAKYMRDAIMSYQDSMEQFSQLAIDTAIDLVQNASSEKVRADLAVEGIRHKIGTPVQKVAVREQKTVMLTFGEPPKEDHIIEGEVVDKPVENKTPDVLDDIFN